MRIYDSLRAPVLRGFGEGRQAEYFQKTFAMMASRCSNPTTLASARHVGTITGNPMRGPAPPPAGEEFLPAQAGFR